MEKGITLHFGKSKVNMDMDVLTENGYYKEVENYLSDLNKENRKNYTLVKVEGNDYFVKNLK